MSICKTCGQENHDDERAIKILKQISEWPSDTKFNPEIEAAIDSLLRRDWIEIDDSPDGQYVYFTWEGERALHRQGNQSSQISDTGATGKQ